MDADSAKLKINLPEIPLQQTRSARSPEGGEIVGNDRMVPRPGTVTIATASTSLPVNGAAKSEPAQLRISRIGDAAILDTIVNEVAIIAAGT